MDPIHPIVPPAQNLPGVSPASGVQRVQQRNQQQRQAAAEQERRRRRQERRRVPDEDPDGEAVDRGDEADGDDGRPHVDISV